MFGSMESTTSHPGAYTVMNVWAAWFRNLLGLRIRAPKGSYPLTPSFTSRACKVRDPLSKAMTMPRCNPHFHMITAFLPILESSQAAQMRSVGVSLYRSPASTATSATDLSQGPHMRGTSTSR